MQNRMLVAYWYKYLLLPVFQALNTTPWFCPIQTLIIYNQLSCHAFNLLVEKRRKGLVRMQAALKGGASHLVVDNLRICAALRVKAEEKDNYAI